MLLNGKRFNWFENELVLGMPAGIPIRKAAREAFRKPKIIHSSRLWIFLNFLTNAGD